MSRLALLIAVPALALSGCGGGDANESANAANAMPPSKTENGQLTVRAQGVDLKINLPPPIRRMAEEDDFLPPPARGQRSGDALSIRLVRGDGGGTDGTVAVTVRN